MRRKMGWEKDEMKNWGIMIMTNENDDDDDDDDDAIEILF